MPVYNSQDYLKISIESILNQTYSDFEFIIIDDGSTDRSNRIIKKYAKKDKRIKLLENKKNLRTSKALNIGLKKAKGKYLIRMDADDWSYPNRIEKQVGFMEEHPKVGVSGGSIEVCDDDLRVLNRRKYWQNDKKIRKMIFRYSPFAHPATIWRAQLVKKVGGYNENIPLAQDYDLYFRVGKLSQFGNMPDILLKLRTHNNSSSIKKGKFQEQFTIYFRIKAFIEYKYHMTLLDKAYTFVQMISMVVIPPKFKFKLFNMLRRYY